MQEEMTALRLEKQALWKPMAFRNNTWNGICLPAMSGYWNNVETQQCIV